MTWEDAQPSIEIIDPRDPAGPQARAIIPYNLVLRLYKINPVAYENLTCAKDVLENPRRIFEGTREHQTGGWCFVGGPGEWHIRQDVIVPFPRNLVFAVYLNPSMVVYDWRAEKQDPDDPLSPLGFGERYRRRIWPHTSLPVT